VDARLSSSRDSFFEESEAEGSSGRGEVRGLWTPVTSMSAIEWPLQKCGWESRNPRWGQGVRHREGKGERERVNYLLRGYHAVSWCLWESRESRTGRSGCAALLPQRGPISLRTRKEERERGACRVALVSTEAARSACGWRRIVMCPPRYATRHGQLVKLGAERTREREAGAGDVFA
jgi:hypothetical protein